MRRTGSWEDIARQRLGFTKATSIPANVTKKLIRKKTISGTGKLDEIKNYFEENGYHGQMGTARATYVETAELGNGIKYAIHISSKDRYIKMWYTNIYDRQPYDDRKDKLKTSS